MKEKKPPLTNAQKQAAHRARKENTVGAQKLLLQALTKSLDLGRSGKIVDNLPEEPEQMLRTLAARLDGVALVTFRRAADK